MDERSRAIAADPLAFLTQLWADLDAVRRCERLEGDFRYEGVYRALCAADVDLRTALDRWPE